jgi:hypothetical protein
MRGGAIGREHVEPVDNRLAHIAMQIIAGRDQHVRPDHIAYRRDEVPLGVEQALDEDGAMHSEIDAIERQRGPDAVEDFGLPAIIERALHRSAGNGAGMQHGDELGRENASGNRNRHP